MYEHECLKDFPSCMNTSVSRISLNVWTRGYVDYVVVPIDLFHLYDMIGNPQATHNDRLKIHWIPTIVEFHMQVGLDMKNS